MWEEGQNLTFIDRTSQPDRTIIVIVPTPLVIVFVDVTLIPTPYCIIIVICPIIMPLLLFLLLVLLLCIGPLLCVLLIAPVLPIVVSDRWETLLLVGRKED